MSEKRYFKVEYDEEWYLFDSNIISEEFVTEQAEVNFLKKMVVINDES